VAGRYRHGGIRILVSPWLRMDQRRRLPADPRPSPGTTPRNRSRTTAPVQRLSWLRGDHGRRTHSRCVASDVGVRRDRDEPFRVVGDPAIVPTGVLSVVRLPLMASSWMKTEIGGVVGEVPIPGVRGRGFGRHSDGRCRAGQGPADTNSSRGAAGRARTVRVLSPAPCCRCPRPDPGRQRPVGPGAFGAFEVPSDDSGLPAHEGFVKKCRHVRPFGPTAP
jgi:hypothetical protein